MEVNLIAAFLLLLNSIRLCYQQDIAVCNIGFEFINGSCVQRFCPDSQVLVNGLCQLKPQTPQQCAVGFTFINGICVQQQICPYGFDLVDGRCQPKATHPTQYPEPIPPQLSCTYGYTLYNGLCYKSIPTAPAPCQPKSCGTFNCASTCSPVPVTMPPTITTPVIVTTPATITTPAPIPVEPPILPPVEIKKGCPPESVLVDGECRLVYCPKGTNYKGRCLEPVCSHGLVWTGHSCGEPEVITTVLEIDNKFITELNQTGPISQEPSIVNNVVYHTESYETSTSKVCSTTATTPTSTSPPSADASTKCCTIITPRMCKRFNSKWVCFNRQYKRCDHVCDNHSTIYLRVPKVIEQHSYVVVPPNPPLQVCANEECATKDLIDCSGCAKNQREGCSAYCYRYRCPKERCTFIDQSEYCTNYPGSSGCSSFDGCTQEWCNNDTITSATNCH